MHLKAAITGNLREFMQKQKQSAEVAVTRGITEVTDSIKLDLREQVISAGLGQRLAKTWRSAVYPKNQASIHAAGVITSKAPKIIRAFNEATVIRSSKGAFLTIPTENCPKRGVGNKRIAPSNFPEHRYGKLRFVYVNGQMSLLVVDKPRRSKSGSPRSIVMFVLIPQVKLRKRLDYQAIADKWAPQIPDAILSNWPNDL